MKKKTKGFSTYLLIFVFVLGLSLLLYPTVSEMWNRTHQTRAIDAYTETVSVLDQESYDKLWADARAYNADTVNRTNPFERTSLQEATYDSVLNVEGTGVIGYVEIPVIECYLAIYHGTSNSVLQKGVGHLEWTSLPVGGESTHCVLSGHRGLPSAKLLTNLNNVVPGDMFYVHVLDEVLTYEVDQILTVLPEDTSAIQNTEGEDYCTLVTCTPYGINTHRLLVRGHRIQNAEDGKVIRITADAIQVEPIIVAPFIAVPLLAVLFIGMTALDRKSRRTRRGG